MRVLTGSLKGRPISFKTNAHLRPTSDKVRKAIVDMLQGALGGKRVLDLFSGTGALGIEALSSGASHVTFVELDRIQSNTLKENLKKLKIEEKSSVRVSDAWDAIRNLSKKEDDRFDIIFLDPPYGKGLGVMALKALSAAGLIHAGTWIFLECGRKERVFEGVGRLEAVKTKTYGDTKLVVYEVRGPRQMLRI